MAAAEGDAQRAAFDAEARRIRSMADAYEAYEAAVRLTDLHAEFRARAADIRAEQTLRIYESGETSMEALAAELGIRKQRVGQLIQRARELAAARTRKPEPQPVVSAVVTSRRGVLITKRRDGKPPWAFCGGEIDQGESPEDAGLRELKEETGMLGISAGEIGRRIHPVTGRLMIYMAVRPARGRTQVFVGDERELLEVRWASLAEALELMPTMYEPVAEHLRRTLRSR